ncbi:gluconokinase [Acetobacteraceae bacterium]|nr:gluconokinase [Acetobacteraceae bacterium]
MSQSSTPEKNSLPLYPMVVMGVCGTGKSCVAKAIAERLGLAFKEGDSLHPQSNVDKMSAGIPLNDEDRVPWLRKCREWLRGEAQKHTGAILTCSALKRQYRERLACGLPVRFVYLKTSRAELEKRLANRKGHFMKPGMLDSQLKTLEEPTADEPVIVVPADAPLEEIINTVVAELKKLPYPQPGYLDDPKAAALAADTDRKV